MLKKQKQIEINSEILYNISIKVIDHYYIEPNLHYILLLSYLTVKEYSRNIQHLDKNAKEELCMKYIPDLLTGLQKANIIDETVHDTIKKGFLSNQEEMKHLLQVYYMIFTYKNDKTIIKTNKCCFT